MCLVIDPKVKSLNKRIVWKVFDCGGDTTGRVVSLYRGAKYPKGELIERSPGLTTDSAGNGTRGLHFYLSQVLAKKHARYWFPTFIAKFAVDPKDFLFASADGEEAMYERATRVGDYIRIKKSRRSKR